MGIILGITRGIGITHGIHGIILGDTHIMGTILPITDIFLLTMVVVIIAIIILQILYTRVTTEVMNTAHAIRLLQVARLLIRVVVQ